jgi:hypothetical protein
MLLVLCSSLVQKRFNCARDNEAELLELLNNGHWLLFYLGACNIFGEVILLILILQIRASKKFRLI